MLFKTGISRASFVVGYIILFNSIQRTGATFGAACVNDAGCSTPSETCSGTNCACSNGYSHDGNGVCVAVDCGSPTDPTNGAISVTGTSYLNTGTVTCDSGYTLVGSSPITCSSSGSWTTIPTCKANSGTSISYEFCSNYMFMVQFVIFTVKTVVCQLT